MIKRTLMLTVLLTIGYATVCIGQKKLETSRLNVRVYRQLTSNPYSEENIYCQTEPVNWRFTNKEVIMKSSTIDISLKIIKKRFGPSKSWVGITELNEYYLFQYFRHSKKRDSLLFRLIDYPGGEFKENLPSIQVSADDICK